MSKTKKEATSLPIKDVKDIIKDALKLDKKEQLNETFVATPKTYHLNTELLSQKTKSAHIALYERYVKAFNHISAEQDVVDRYNANPNDSEYRSYKIDEMFNLNAVYLHELYFANISDIHSEITKDM